jgi:hypothetical protein
MSKEKEKEKVKHLKPDEAKEVLSHMENRTQWHKSDVERVEALRDKVDANKNDGKLPEKTKQKNKVHHHH